jgi:hypothetical protein
MRLHRCTRIRQWTTSLLATLAIATPATVARAQDDFAVMAGLESGKIAVRDASNAAPLVMQRNLPLWEDNSGGIALAPTTEFIPQPTGYDIIYTYQNNSTAPKKQGQFRVGVFTLGPEIDVMEGGWKDARERHQSAEGYKIFARYYPLNMYSPIWTMRDDRYAVGVAVQYPLLEYKHDLRFTMRKSAGAAASGEGGPGWWLEVRLSKPLTEPAGEGILYDAIIQPGETRRYVVNVRVTDRSDEWVRTLTPYRDFFRNTYGGVRYDRKPAPVNAITLAVDESASPENPYGWNMAAQRSPEVHGWSKWVDDIGSRTGWGGYMLWKPTGVFLRNTELNFPFQFTSRWLENDNLRSALDSKTGFPAIIRRTRGELGFWWGRSCQVMLGWDDGHFEPLDPDNPIHVEACRKEVALAARSGATMIGLDTFSHKYTPIWKLYPWLQRMQFMFPQMRFVIEPITCDVMHTLAPTFLRGYADKEVVTSQEDLYQIKGPHILADFLLPGHEIWAGFRYLGLRTYFGLDPTTERIHDDMRRYASYGQVPVFFVDMPLSVDDIQASESWLTTIPEDLQIPRKDWKYKAPASLTINSSGPAGLVDDGTRDDDAANQLPVSGMGETLLSRSPKGPDEDDTAEGSMLMTSGSGRGPVLTHLDAMNALSRASVTRLGGVQLPPSSLPAQIRTGNERLGQSQHRLPLIFTGRSTRHSTIVIAPTDDD